MNVQIDVQGMEEIKRSLDDIGRQAPFAVSLALNALANDAQQGVQGTLSQRFTLRRAEFIKRTIKRERQTDFATKAKLEAIVRVDPSRDFLAKFEESGEKTPINGRRMLAIPTEAVRPTPGALIRAADRPRAVLRQTNVDSGKAFVLNGGIYRVRGRGRRAVLQKLYTLKPRVPIRARLGFYATATGEVERAWPARFTAAIERAMATAKP